MLGFKKVFTVNMHIEGGHTVSYEDCEGYKISWGESYTITFAGVRKDRSNIDPRKILAVTTSKPYWTHKLVLWFKY